VNDWTITKKELGRMWNETVIAVFDMMLLWHFPGGTEESHKRPQSE
jgi:hypothetical protein